MTTKIKYSMLALNHFRRVEKRYDLDEKSFVVPGKELSFLEDKDISHWKDWLGTLKFDELSESDAVFVSWDFTETPGVLDGDNIQLSTIGNEAWHSLLFVRTTYPFNGNSFIFSGEGELDGDKVRPTNVRQFSENFTLTRQPYKQQKDFYDNTREVPFSVDDVIADWKSVICDYASAKSNGLPSVFSDAVESFTDARRTRVPTTAISRFVESAEAFLGLPFGKGGGAKGFKKRALPFMKKYVTHPYVAMNESQMTTLLETIYKLRNSRSHGMGMYDNVVKNFNISEQDEEKRHAIMDLNCAKAFFIAERLAVELIREFLTKPKWMDMLSPRQTLEESWNSEKIKA